MALARNAKNATLAEKLIDLYADHLALVEANQKLLQQAEELRRDIEESKKIPDITARLEHVMAQNAYYVNNAERRDGPYCTTCWDVDRKLVRLMVGLTRIPICNICVRRGPKNKVLS